MCITISSQLSATGQAAQMAAKSVQGEIAVRTVDSLTVTMGLGMMAASAARLAAEGRSVEEVAAAAEALVPRTRVYGALDTLENLKKGGRVGGAQALIGSMLSIKPIIEVRDGVVEPESRQRTRSRALRYLADKVRQEGEIENLAVMHGDAPDLDEFIELLEPLVPRERMVIGRNADCFVVLNVPAVSREHAILRKIQTKFYIEDNKSSNGTLVNAAGAGVSIASANRVTRVGRPPAPASALGDAPGSR